MRAPRLAVTALAATLALLPSLAPAQDDPADAVAVRSAMLRVTAPAAVERAADLLPFNAMPGTAVTLLLEPAEGRRIVAIDHEASRIERFSDGAGTDLLEPRRSLAADRAAAPRSDADEPGPERAGDGPIAAPWLTAADAGDAITSFPRVSADGRFATLEVAAPRVPHPDATSLTIQGRLALRLADGSRSHTIDDVPLAADRTLDLSDMDVDGIEPIEITRVRTVRWADYELDVTFDMSRETFRRLAEVRFHDESGERIASSPFAVSTMGPRATVQYGLAEPLERATVELIFHDGIRTLEVPLRLEVSLGL